jgi:hypothetical protein
VADTARYDVYIEGVKDPSASGRERLSEALASHYGLPIDQARRVVAGGRFRVKRDVELALARRYISHLEALGARTSMSETAARPSAPRPAVSAPAPASAAPAARIAAPARPAAPPVPAAARVCPAAPPSPADDGIHIGALAADRAGGLALAPAASPPVAPPPAAAPADFGLISLDGSSELALALESAAAPGASGARDPFLPPDAQEESGLELERTTAPAAPVAPVDPFEPDEAPAELALDLDTSGHGAAAAPAPASGGKPPAGGFGLDEAPPPATAHVATTPAPAAPAPAAPAAARPAAAPSAPRPAPARTSTTRAAAPAPWLLFGGRLRDQAAVRLLVGVLLCVGLSFAPASMYASHHDTSVIRPLQLEERELREKPPRPEAVRQPQAVREEIGSARRKGFVVTLVIWLFGSAVLSLLWFRFT